MQEPTEPTWNDDIGALFAQPYWIVADRRAATGATWIGCMQGYGIDLSSYASVKQWSPLIYQYLHGGEMPLTANPRHGRQFLHRLRSGVLASPALAGADQAQPPDELLVCFDGVRCTFDSYAIDVFLEHDDPQPADIDAANPNYVGRLSRIGMGQEDDKDRCITSGVLRMLDATPAARALGIALGSRCRLSLLVSALPSGRVLAADEYKALPGFTPRLDWSRSGWVARRTAPEQPASASCCHIREGSEAEFLSVTDAKTSPTEGIVPCH